MVKTSNFDSCRQVTNGPQLTLDFLFAYFCKSLASESVGCLDASQEAVIDILSIQW